MLEVIFWLFGGLVLLVAGALFGTALSLRAVLSSARAIVKDKNDHHTVEIPFSFAAGFLGRPQRVPGSPHEPWDAQEALNWHEARSRGAASASPDCAPCAGIRRFARRLLKKAPV